MIWISPGWPLLTGPRIQLSDKDQQRIFNQVVGLSDSLRQARITLYTVDPLGTADAGGFRTSYYLEFVKGVKKPRMRTLFTSSLLTVSSVTVPTNTIRSK